MRGNACAACAARPTNRGKAFPLGAPSGWSVDKAQQAVALPTASRLRRARTPFCIQKMPGPSLTTLEAVNNGSTRFASPISGCSRLIPELEKTQAVQRSPLTAIDAHPAHQTRTRPRPDSNSPQFPTSLPQRSPITAPTRPRPVMSAQFGCRRGAASATHRTPTLPSAHLALEERAR